jgi:3-deoxy-D-manno-octulosonic-acid transferase
LATLERSGTAEGLGAVVVDRLGVLAQLYTAADAAYVGGGFGRRGLHSVLEPAAAGAPVVFGPRHRSARAAGELLRLGAAREAADAAALRAVLADWLDDPVAKDDAAERCLDYIGAHLGAAVRTAELLDPLIGQEDQA